MFSARVAARVCYDECRIGGNKEIRVMYRIPLVFTPQPEGGYTVTSPALPELITEGDTLEEAQRNVQDAFEAVVEIYSEQNRRLPVAITLPAGEVLWSEALVAGV